MAEEMIPVTEAEVTAARKKLESAADAMVEQVKDQFASAGRYVGFSPNKIAQWLSVGSPIAAGVTFFDWVTGASQQAGLEHNMEYLGGYISEWSTTRRKWALKGVREDGSEYGYDRWADEGREYIQAAKDYAKMAWDQSSIGYFLGAVKDTWSDYINLMARFGRALADPPSLIPWWVPAIIGGVGLVAVWMVYRDFRPAVKVMAEEGSLTARAAGARARRALNGRRRR